MQFGFYVIFQMNIDCLPKRYQVGGLRWTRTVSSLLGERRRRK